MIAALIKCVRLFFGLGLNSSRMPIFVRTNLRIMGAVEFDGTGTI
jgi:hypothetical protein